LKGLMIAMISFIDFPEGSLSIEAILLPLTRRYSLRDIRMITDPPADIPDGSPARTLQNA
ncbi:MAG TPA: hypothetical protein DCL95_14020, partial [Rhodospirillaceae bacterium]|nr:hypothetical protein [Rhodospirillaceae bacterium]